MSRGHLNELSRWSITLCFTGTSSEVAAELLQVRGALEIAQRRCDTAVTASCACATTLWGNLDRFCCPTMPVAAIWWRLSGAVLTHGRAPGPKRWFQELNALKHAGACQVHLRQSHSHIESIKEILIADTVASTLGKGGYSYEWSEWVKDNAYRKKRGCFTMWINNARSLHAKFIPRDIEPNQSAVCSTEVFGKHIHHFSVFSITVWRGIVRLTGVHSECDWLKLTTNNWKTECRKLSDRFWTVPSPTHSSYLALTRWLVFVSVCAALLPKCSLSPEQAHILRRWVCRSKLCMLTFDEPNLLCSPRRTPVHMGDLDSASSRRDCQQVSKELFIQ